MFAKRPFVTIKIAQSFDGKIAARGGKSRWITGPESRAFVHRLRSQHDAVLVGKNTFVLDRPRLSSLQSANPVWKIILASPDFLPVHNPRLFDAGSQVIFVVEKKDLKKWLREKSLQNKPCLFLPVSKTKREGYDLPQLMEKLAKIGIKKILVEGGGEVFWSFLKNRLADRIYWMIATKVIGGRSAKTSVEGEGFKNPNQALEMNVKKVTKLGRDYCFEATLKGENLKQLSSPRKRGPNK